VGLANIGFFFMPKIIHSEDICSVEVLEPSHLYITRSNKGVHLSTINFHHGPYGSTIVKGITNEALIAILIDRLETLNQGQWEDDFNHRAINSLKEAKQSLEERAISRKQSRDHKTIVK
jgi:hypothetical protein